MLTMPVRRALAAAAAATAVTTMTTLATGSPAWAASSEVYVVHGIPATPVDVYVNGAITLRGFQPGQVAGPLTLPEGTYDIDITKPGEPVSSAILSVPDAAVPGGANLSIVAHLNTDDKPTITPFVNDVSAVPAGKARLVVRHTAAAPAVDVRAAGTPVISGLTNPHQAELEVDAGTVSADVVLAGTSTVAIPATDLNLAEGSVTVVYAIGSAQAKTLAVVAQVLTGSHTAPKGVDAGDGGLAADRPTAGWALAASLGLLLLVAGGVKLAATRR